MIRILHVMGSMGVGGAETFIMKLFRTIDKEEYMFDFVLNENETFFYEPEILALGGKIHRIPLKSDKPLSSFVKLAKIVKNNKYKIVLRASAHSFSFLDLFAAFFGGARARIIRSTNTSVGPSRVQIGLHKVGIPILNMVSTLRLAPSLEAAQWMFGQANKTVIIKNGIDIEQFRFNELKRNKLRQEQGINESFVVGHIGRFSLQKNHMYVIDVFYEIKKQRKDAVLVLVGEGELNEQIKEKLNLLNLEKSVIFTGIRTDIPDLLMAMDVFIFPSLYEGMPNVLIEAQATGLKCIASDTITNEVLITESISMRSINEPASHWAKEILENPNTSRKESADQVSEAGYNIRNVVNVLTDYYSKYK